MAWVAPNHNSLTTRLVVALRKKPSAKSNAKAVAKRNELNAKRASLDAQAEGQEDSWGVDSQLGERRAIGSLDSVLSETSTLVNRSQRGSVDTEYMHSLVHHDSFDSTSKDLKASWKPEATPSADAEGAIVDPQIVAAHERMIASLSHELWRAIAAFLSPTDAASLAHSSKTLRQRLGSEPWDALNREENKQYRIEFLVHLDHKLPRHLLCFPCASYHRRTQPQLERLEANYVLNPLFNCPKVHSSVLPRARLTHGRELPYSFVQLAVRARQHTPSHGIPYDTLGRRWKCSDSKWSHRTRFHVSKGHLLFRSVSMCYAPPDLTPSQERLLLYSRTNYMPYFSVCAHWQDGELMNLCKCAVSHIPRPPDPIGQQLRRRPKISLEATRPNFIVHLCDECRPMRRCPDCPTEYLIELRMVEDKSDRQTSFKHALVVTRWSDLGDGTSPLSLEWAACNGQADYDSFAAVGRRAIAGVFESECSNTVPGQRILSLNPRRKSLGEAGNDWY